MSQLMYFVYLFFHTYIFHIAIIYLYISLSLEEGRERSDCLWLRDTASEELLAPGEYSTTFSPEKKQKRAEYKASKMGTDIFIITKVIMKCVCVGVEEQGENTLINLDVTSACWEDAIPLFSCLCYFYVPPPQSFNERKGETKDEMPRAHNRG